MLSRLLLLSCNAAGHHWLGLTKAFTRFVVQAGDLSWLATCGNAAALLAFGLCLVLHPKVTEVPSPLHPLTLLYLLIADHLVMLHARLHLP